MSTVIAAAAAVVVAVIAASIGARAMMSTPEPQTRHQVAGVVAVLTGVVTAAFLTWPALVCSVLALATGAVLIFTHTVRRSTHDLPWARARRVRDDSWVLLVGGMVVPVVVGGLLASHGLVVSVVAAAAAGCAAMIALTQLARAAERRRRAER